MMIGYARVSKFEGYRVIDPQRDVLTGAGVDPERIYENRLSGSRDDRPGLAACWKALRSGDPLVVWRLDRLGRTVNQLIMLIEKLRAAEIDFRALTEEIDISTPAGAMYFHIFAAVAQTNAIARANARQPRLKRRGHAAGCAGVHRCRSGGCRARRRRCPTRMPDRRPLPANMESG